MWQGACAVRIAAATPILSVPPLPQDKALMQRHMSMDSATMPELQARPQDILALHGIMINGNGFTLSESYCLPVTEWMGLASAYQRAFTLANTRIRQRPQLLNFFLQTSTNRPLSCWMIST